MPEKPTFLRPALIVALCLVAAIPAARPAGARPLRTPRAEQSRPNVVVILTDDQRPDQLAMMPALAGDLVARGVSFTNSFVSNPLCCPSRTTFLTGQTSGHTGVWWSTPRDPYGGFPAFRPPKDGNTLATWLHGAGYDTALVGKYLNSYNLHNYMGYVPPGWDRWYSWVEGTGKKLPGCDNGGYVNWCSWDGSHLVFHGKDPADYSTDVFAQVADDFIRGVPAQQPLFLFFTPHAPHGPTTPPDRYRGTCDGLELPTSPSFNEQDVSDKPAYVRGLPLLTGKKIAKKVTQWRNACATLRATDDAIRRILEALQATGRLSDTFILFASDNGLSYGEHRVLGKAVPYEESLRVPLVIRYDPLTGPVAGSNSDEPVVNLDYASTIAEVTGVTPGVPQDGLSLMPLVADPSATLGRDGFVIQHHAQGDLVPDYCGVRAPGFTYAQYETGEEELYDLDADPSELNNVAGLPGYAATLDALRARAHVLCDPPPPGWTWHH